MTNQKKVIIIHGSFGSPSENWFPWLADEVRKMGYEVIVPVFPTPEDQNLENWLLEFRKQVGDLTSNMVLVGHSLAPGFILNLLEISSVSVLGIFLVSGFLGKLGLDEFDTVNETFVCREFNWEKIKHNAGKVQIYQSDNDPYVPLEKGQELADNLRTPLTIIKNGGHINASSGFKEFPLLRDDLYALLAD